MQEYPYVTAVTAIIEKDGRFLITRRVATKKKWPGRWTVPGGKLEPSDYVDLPKDSEKTWYNVIERVLRREVKEEVGLAITDIEYLTSIVADYAPAMTPVLILSFLSRCAGGDLKLQENEVDDAKWVTAEESKQYDLIGGIYEELVMAEDFRKGIYREWNKTI